MSVDTVVIIDPFLATAQKQWEMHLDQGVTAYHAQNWAEALQHFSVAVSESARYHPLFHYLESGLHTELAQLHCKNNDFELAHTHFKRALFLHHDNETAQKGLEIDLSDGTEHVLPPYPFAALTATLPPPQQAAGCIRSLRMQARNREVTEAISAYQEMIEICEATHLAYHSAASLPWLWRAKTFIKQGETALARNDAIRGLDLDRKNIDLASLAAMPLS